MGKLENVLIGDIYVSPEFIKSKKHAESFAITEISYVMSQTANDRTLQKFNNVKFMHTPEYTVEPLECEKYLRGKQHKTVVYLEDDITYLGTTKKKDAICINVIIYFPGKVEELKNLQKLYRKMLKDDIRNYFRGTITASNIKKSGNKATMIFMYGDEDCKKRRIV